MNWIEKNKVLLIVGAVAFYLWNRGILFPTGAPGQSNASSGNQVVPLGDGTYGVL